MFDFSAVIPHLPQLLVGLASTLLVSLSAIALGLVLGWAICLGLTGRRSWLRCSCKIYGLVPPP